MPETLLETPFGVVRLIADGGEATRWIDAAPLLPEGGRIDACKRAEIRRAPGPAAEIAVVVEWTLGNGVEAGPDTGEALEATSFEAPGLTATVAVRDGTWIDAQPGLRLVEFSGTAASALHVIAIDQGAALAFPAAAAWTLNPTTEEERIAPWLAADLALP